MDMRFYRACQISHSILSHFLDRGFSGWRAQNWASIAPYPTNSTQSFAIYKLTGRLDGSTLHFYCSMSSKQHSEFCDIQIDRRTLGLAGSRLPLFTNEHPYQLPNIYKKNDFQILNY